MPASPQFNLIIAQWDLLLIVDLSRLTMGNQRLAAARGRDREQANWRFQLAVSVGQSLRGLSTHAAPETFVLEQLKLMYSLVAAVHPLEGRLKRTKRRGERERVQPCKLIIVAASWWHDVGPLWMAWQEYRGCIQISSSHCVGLPIWRSIAVRRRLTVSQLGKRASSSASRTRWPQVVSWVEMAAWLSVWPGNRWTLS